MSGDPLTMPQVTTEDPAPEPVGTVGVRLLRAWPYALVALVGLLVLLPSLGEFGFWDPWEPKYAQSALEMKERGSYVVPYYRDDVRLTKPILVYWGILAGSAVFGMNELGARIGGVTLAILSALGVFYAVSLLRGRRAGLIAALVLCSLPHFGFLSRQAMPDAYLFPSIGSCLLFFCLGLFGPERRRNLHFAISYVGFSLAVLAKGPVLAGVIFFVTLAIYAVAVLDWSRLWQPELRGRTLWLVGAGLPATLAVAAMSVTAFLYGTSSDWWGYSTARREEVAVMRDRLSDTLVRFRLAELLLGALLLASGLLAYRVSRGDRSPRRLAGAACLGVLGALALTALLAGGSETRIFVASLLGSIAAAGVIVFVMQRLLTAPVLWGDVRPTLGRIARQVALFVAVFAVVAGPWHIAILIKQGHGYFTDFIIKHNIQRAGEKINRTGVSDFYLRTMIFGLFPWCAFVPIAIASLVGWWRRNPFRADGPAAYLLIAGAVTYAMFSLSATKFAHYLSPLIIPVAVLVALAIDRTFQDRQAPASRLSWIVAAMLYLVPMLDLLREDGIKYLIGSFTMKRSVPPDSVPGSYYSVLLVLIFVFMLASALVRSRVLLGGLLATSLLVAQYNSGTFIPQLSHHKSLKTLTDVWKEHRRDDAPLGMIGDFKHGMFFYTERNWQRLTGAQRFSDFMDPQRPKFCIVERNLLSRMRANYDRRYPDAPLYLVDDSHQLFDLLANHPITGSLLLKDR